MIVISALMMQSVQGRETPNFATSKISVTQKKPKVDLEQSVSEIYEQYIAGERESARDDSFGDLDVLDPSFNRYHRIIRARASYCMRPVMEIVASKHAKKYHIDTDEMKENLQAVVKPMKFEK
jgi:hypothetical protein